MGMLLLFIALLAGAAWLDHRIMGHVQSQPGEPPVAALPPEAERYLGEVDAGLDLPARVRAEIRAELTAHLVDSIAAIEAEGLGTERAVREATARLGNPDDLARALDRAHKSTRRLLAGAAGGIFEAGIGAIAGTILGYVVAVLGVLAAALLLATVLKPPLDFVAGLLPRFSTESTQVGANAALGFFVAWFAAWAAARRAVMTSYHLSQRSARSVRLIWAAVGFVAIGGLVLFVVTTQQTWLVVPLELGVPIAFAAGALTLRSFRVPLPRPAVWVVIALGLSLPIVLLAAMAPSVTTGGDTYSYDATPAMRARDQVARPWSDESKQFVVNSSSESMWLSSAVAWTAEVTDPVAFAGFRDLRVEVWRATPYAGAPVGIQDHELVPDPAYSAPYATRAVVGTSSTLSATFDMSHVRTTHWLVYLTGTGPDGQRYRLDWPQPYTTAFNGTVWDWLTSSS